MGNVYSLDAERNLILYRAGTNLYIRTTSGESMTRPVTLCMDYKDSLTDTTYNGTVYYAYRSTEQDLVVRSITDLQNIYKISSQEIPDCYDPRLVTFRDELVLFYTTKSPLNNAYYLKAVFPLKPEIRIKLPETAFSETLNLGILVMADRLILSAASQEQQILFSLNPAFEPVIYSSDNPALKTQLQDTQQKLDNTSAQLHDTQQKLNTTSKALLDTQQKLNMAAKNLRDTQQKVVKLESDLQAQSQSHSETIENIRTQYNELMETATRYREEAVRWHDIAYKKDVKPVPGESLIADNW